MRIKVPKEADRGAGPAKARTTPITHVSPHEANPTNSSDSVNEAASQGRYASYPTDRSVTCQGVTPIRDLDAVTEWLRSWVDLPGRDDLPLLGSPEWIAAPESVRVASLCRHALTTVSELDPGVVAARLAAEIAIGRSQHLASRKQASVAISEAFDWAAVAQRRRSGWSR